MINKVKSCIVTGILGDAYGSRFERMDLPSGNETWEFSADTQLVIATCDAVVGSDPVTDKALARIFSEWYTNGRLSGLGASGLRTIVRLVSGRSFGATDEAPTIAENDLAARVAPFAFLLDPLVPEEEVLFRQMCTITHRDAEAYAAALAVVLAIRFIQNDRSNFIQNVIRHLPESEVKEKLSEMSSFQDLSIRELGRKFGSRSYAKESVPLALFAAEKAQELGIKGMMKGLVAAEGDTGTNCCIAGQVAGTKAGWTGIPEEWMLKLRETAGFERYLESVNLFAEKVAREKGINTLF